MPYRYSWKPLQVMISMWRVYSAMMYLWAMFCAASLVPVLLVKKTTRFFWITTEDYSLTYTFTLPFIIVQIIVPMTILIMIYRLYLACRCKFLGSFNTRIIVPPNRKITALDTLLLFPIALYLAGFIICWLDSSNITYQTVLKTYRHQPTEQQIFLYYELALVVLIKMLVLLNVIDRTVRGCIIFFELFDRNSNQILRNDPSIKRSKEFTPTS